MLSIFESSLCSQPQLLEDVRWGPYSWEGMRSCWRG